MTRYYLMDKSKLEELSDTRVSDYKEKPVTAANLIAEMFSHIKLLEAWIDLATRRVCITCKDWDDKVGCKRFLKVKPYDHGCTDYVLGEPPKELEVKS